MKNKIADDVRDILKTVDILSRAEHIDYFIAGATARDIIFWNMNNVKLIRATTDIDVMVCLKDWTSYRNLKSAFLKKKGFSSDKKTSHRLIYQNRPIDLIPYGLIASNNIISWPPEYETQIDTTGFSEAFKSMMRIDIDKETYVNFVSVPGLVVLKLISWNDNPNIRGKDIYDLAYVLKNYDRINPEEKLFEENADLLNNDNFDYEIAWCHILGRDIANDFNEDICKLINKILSKEISNPETSQLITKMLQDNKESLKKNIEYLNALNFGLEISL